MKFVEPKADPKEPHKGRWKCSADNGQTWAFFDTKRCRWCVPTDPKEESEIEQRQSIQESQTADN